MNLLVYRITKNNSKILLIIGIVMYSFSPEHIETYCDLVQSYLLMYTLRYFIKNNPWLNENYPRIAQFIVVFLEMVLLYIL
jgi:hypothetical protein